MARRLRERPRLVPVLALAVVGLIALGLLAGMALGGGDDRTGATAVERAPTPQAGDLRRAHDRLRASEGELRRLEREARGRRSRTEALRQRARRLERRNRDLRRALARARRQ